MLYEFLFCAGLLDQNFEILSLHPRQSILCADDRKMSKMFDLLTQPSTVVIGHVEGDITQLLQVSYDSILHLVVGVHLLYTLYMYILVHNTISLYVLHYALYYIMHFSCSVTLQMWIAK